MPGVASGPSSSDDLKDTAWHHQHEARIEALAAKVAAEEHRQQDSLDAIQRAADPEWDRKRAAEALRRRLAYARRRQHG